MITAFHAMAVICYNAHVAAVPVAIPLMFAHRGEFLLLNHIRKCSCPFRYLSLPEVELVPPFVQSDANIVGSMVKR